MHDLLTKAIFGASVSKIDGSRLPGARSNNATASELQVILGIFFGIAGAIAVLMIVINGLQFITSTGDPQKAARARSGIIYALVGLAVAISAEAIVAFVVGKL